MQWSHIVLKKIKIHFLENQFVFNKIKVRFNQSVYPRWIHGAKYLHNNNNNKKNKLEMTSYFLYMKKKCIISLTLSNIIGESHKSTHSERFFLWLTDLLIIYDCVVFMFWFILFFFGECEKQRLGFSLFLFYS